MHTYQLNLNKFMFLLNLFTLLTIISSINYCTTAKVNNYKKIQNIAKQKRKRFIDNFVEASMQSISKLTTIISGSFEDQKLKKMLNIYNCGVMNIPSIDTWQLMWRFSQPLIENARENETLTDPKLSFCFVRDLSGFISIKYSIFAAEGSKKNLEFANPFSFKISKNSNNVILSAKNNSSGEIYIYNLNNSLTELKKLNVIKSNLEYNLLVHSILLAENMFTSYFSKREIPGIVLTKGKKISIQTNIIPDIL